MLRVVSLFSGAGGLDIGFERTGYFRTLACFDSDKDCVETLSTNSRLGRSTKKHTFLREAMIATADLGRPAASVEALCREPVDVVIGGPPCQAFSVLGKRRGTNDARGSLVFSYLTTVEQLQSRAFVLENVPGFASIDQGGTFSAVLERARALGYECWFGKLCAADYGDPTIRTRFFLVGVRDPKGPLRAPAVTHGTANTNVDSTSIPDLLTEHRIVSPLAPHRTVSDALIGLDDPEVNGRNLNAHIAVRHQASTVERFRMLQPGERDVARRRNRLRLDAPALTLFSGGIKGKKQARTHIHPIFPRELTPRECARLHSFPDYWEFSGATDSVLTQVSNSVPIELGSAVARMVAQACGEMPS